MFDKTGVFLNRRKGEGDMVEKELFERYI